MNTTVTVLFIIIIVFCFISYYDNHRFKVSRYHLKTSKIERNLKIIVLADLHDKQYGTDNVQLLNVIQDENPDLIILAGDMVTADKNTSHFKTFLFIRTLSLKYPVYYGFGNHENKMKSSIEDTGAIILDNKGLFIEENSIHLIGLNLDKKYFAKGKYVAMEKNYLNEKLPPSQPDLFQILIAHNPIYFKEYQKWGADLSVSGHVHGGTIRLFNKLAFISPSFHLFPKYHGGLYEENGCKMLVSRGLGMHTIPIRIFNPADLLVLQLEAEKS